MKEQKMPEESEPSNKSLVTSISSTISKFRKQVLLDRVNYVKTRLEANSTRLQSYITQTEEFLNARAKLSVKENELSGKDAPNADIQRVLCKFGGSVDGALSEMESVALQEEGCISSAIVLGTSSSTKSIVRPVKLNAVQKIPTYTTWIFLDRNQRMAEDQSVVGRRRIYYDSAGNEALICSDSEEEQVEEEEDKHDFTKGDDFIIRETVQEHGLTKTVLKVLTDCIDARASEMEARYEFLKRESEVAAQAAHQEISSILKSNASQCSSPFSDSKNKNDANKQECLDNHKGAYLDEGKYLAKDLSSAMDSFDKLFCRRCLVFDCHLHGCSQPVVLPTDRQPPWSKLEQDAAIPCGPQCWLMMNPTKLGEEHGNAFTDKNMLFKDQVQSPLSNRGLKFCSNPESPTCVAKNECSFIKGPEEVALVQSMPKRELSRKGIKDKRLTVLRRLLRRNVDKNNRRDTKDSSQGKQNGKSSGSLVVEADVQPKKNGDTVLQEFCSLNTELASPKEIHKSRIVLRKNDCLNNRAARRPCSLGASKAKSGEASSVLYKDGNPKFSPEVKLPKCSPGKDLSGVATKPGLVGSWTPLERGLCEKGIQMFGRNSCLIAKNLLKGLKSCTEVAQLMNEYDSTTQKGCGDGSKLHGDGSGIWNLSNNVDVGSRSRLYSGRRKGRVRKLKYTWKSASRPTIKKRIAVGKDQPCKQYNSCSCLFMCGKQCSCMRSNTCCEKYCGCSKVCKNRFRGCHCAKSQCCSRQCPCFAAGRECDPDVCRNCWIGCGDGTLGTSISQGDNYECHNMKLLLKQQQRVLLGKSDVAGWGAYLKNPVNKHDYLGEYTGELISHREADKRGKIYDRENSSFLFNLNDQYVLDACRKGDKLKFANHSPNPNCYAKVIMVAGDHRVGIFAKEKIAAGEELFYDYRYEPERAPVWARKPEDTSAKHDEPGTASKRSQKNA